MFPCGMPMALTPHFDPIFEKRVVRGHFHPKTSKHAFKKIKGYSHLTVTHYFQLVPRAGLEPAQLLPLPPQDSVSTSSTTSARRVLYRKVLHMASIF